MNGMPTEYPNLLALLTAVADTDYPNVRLTIPAQSEWRYRIYDAAWGKREIGAFTDEGWVHVGEAYPVG